MPIPIEQPSVRVALSIPEVMLRCGLGRDRIYKSIREGRLKAKKLGRRTVVLASDLQSFLEALPAMDGAA